MSTIATPAAEERLEAEPEAAGTLASTRYHALDGLRASMMFLGIFLHAMLPYLPVGDDGEAGGGLYRDASAVSPWYLVLVLAIHSFRMPAFFVMAGFFAATTDARVGPRGLLASRFRRVAIPFAVGWLILYPTLVATGRWLGTNPNRGLFSRVGPAHLWFLEVLMILIPLTLAARAVATRCWPGSPRWLDARFRALMSRRTRAAWLALPTALTLCAMSTGSFDTPMSFLVPARVILAYGLFFGFGWMLARHPDLLATFPRLARTQLALASMAWPVGVFAGIMLVTTRPEVPPAVRGLSALTGALMAWLGVFGLTGLFVRHFDRPSKVVRYLTDASYWCYLAHLPVVFWAAALLAPLPWPSPVKVAGVTLLAAAASLLTYQIFVRPTFLGRWLGGPGTPSRPERNITDSVRFAS